MNDSNLNSSNFKVKPHKKKIKKLSLRVKWFRFKDRHPRLFVYAGYIAGGVIFALILLTIFFFRKLDQFKELIEIIE